jgi:putative copper export protein
MAALGGFLLARRRPRAGWALAALGAVALAFTPGLSGHAAATPGRAALAVLSDAIHVLSAGGWLGSLLVLLAAGIPAARRLGEGRRGEGVAALVAAFTPTALLFAGILVATGLFAAWLHLGPVQNLWQSEYGRTLLLKLGVLVLVFGTGAYNFLRVAPVLGGDTGTRRLRRSAGFELAVGAVVLAVTAVLVATSPPVDTGGMHQAAAAATEVERSPRWRR